MSTLLEITNLLDEQKCSDLLVSSSRYFQHWQTLFNFIVLVQNILIPKKYIIAIFNFRYFSQNKNVLLDNENIKHYLTLLKQNEKNRDHEMTGWNLLFVDFYEKLACKNPGFDFKYFILALLIFQYQQRINPNDMLREDMNSLQDSGLVFSAYFFYYYQWFLIFSIALNCTSFQEYDSNTNLSKKLKECIINCQHELFTSNYKFFLGFIPNNKVLISSDNLQKDIVNDENIIDLRNNQHLLDIINRTDNDYLDIYNNFHWGATTKGYDIINKIWNKIANGINIISLSTGNGACEIITIIYSIIFLNIKIDTLYICDIIYKTHWDSIKSIKCLLNSGLIKRLVVCKSILDLYKKITPINHIILEYSPYKGIYTEKKYLPYNKSIWLEIDRNYQDLSDIIYLQYTNMNPMKIIKIEKLKKLIGSRFEVVSYQLNDKIITTRGSDFLYLLSKFNNLPNNISLKSLKEKFSVLSPTPFPYNKDNIKNIKLIYRGSFLITNILNYTNINTMLIKKITSPLITFSIYDKDVETHTVNKNCGKIFNSSPNDAMKYDFRIHNFNINISDSNPTFSE